LEYYCCRGSPPSTATTTVAVGATAAVRPPDHFAKRCRFDIKGKKGTQGKNKGSQGAKAGWFPAPRMVSAV